MKNRVAMTLALMACASPPLIVACVAFAQQPAGAPADPANESFQAIRVRYTEAVLELAKVDLALYEEANRRVPRTYTAAEIQRQQDAVRLGEAQLQIVKQQNGAQGDMAALQLARAEQEARQAKRAYSDALESNRVDPAYSELKLKRLQLQVEKAQLRLAMWTDPTSSTVDHIHWELDRLSEEVFTLQKRFDDLLQQIGQE